MFDPCPPAAKAVRDVKGRLRDGLVIPWHPFNFVNPPFSAKCIPKWIDRAYQEKLKGNTTWMLAPMNVNRVWFKERCNKHIWDEIMFYDGPGVKFIHQVTGKPMFSVHSQFFFLIFDGAMRTPALTPMVVEETLRELPEPTELERTRSDEEFVEEYIEGVQCYESQQFDEDEYEPATETETESESESETETESESESEWEGAAPEPSAKLMTTPSPPARVPVKKSPDVGIALGFFGRIR
jgi:hypothetical protein